MKIKLTILFILDTLVLVLLTYFLFYQIEHWKGLLSIICLAIGVGICIGAFLILYTKFLKLPVHHKKS